MNNYTIVEHPYTPQGNQIFHEGGWSHQRSR